MASTSLTRTPSSNGNQKTWTLSCWIKRAGIGNVPTIIDGYYGNQSRYATIYFDSNDKFNVFSGLYSTGSSTSYLINYTTNRVFRDTSAWYHIVVAVDTTQATAGDRVKIYINGVQETSFSTETQPAQNTDTYFNVTTSAMRMGVNGFDGIMSHVHWIDGTQYAASTFGSTDSTTGEWKINTNPTVTHGTNGFFIFKDSASVTDQSGNSNNLTVSGTLTNTEDNPSNVFATMSPIDKSGLSAGYSTLTNGNTRQDTVSASQNSGSRSTLAVNSGKWYVEAKAFGSASPEFRRIGILGMDSSTWITATNSALTSHAEGYAYKSDGNKGNNGSEVSYANSYTNGDIIGIAFDADNGAIWFSKNGTWQNSATISEIAAGTTTNAAFSSIPMTRFYGFAATLAGATSNMGFEWNFGNGFFGTTAISSEGTNASNIGKFEYDVPTGFTALSTKGLNE